MKINESVEIQEAISAGERVLDRIDEAIDYLDSARNWGLLDMFSKRSFLSSMIKHSKMDDAERVMRKLEDDLYRFEKELRDVNVLSGIPDISTGDFFRFVDIFMDNTFVDIMALSRISDSKKQLNRLADEVEDILDELDRLSELY
ncbi:MAG: hypothetical protein Q4D13_03665 [Erysipelotrichaceae bacterium]|nr:hypothetical protein [Erysipelotrichaceae bacterium]